MIILTGITIRRLFGCSTVCCRERRRKESRIGSKHDVEIFVIFGLLYEIIRVRIRLVDACTDTHLHFYFLVWIEELPLDGTIGGREEPPKKSRIDDDAYNWKKILGNASLTGIFCLYKIATYTSVSFTADVLFFSLLLNTLCRQARRQAVSQRKWSIPVVHILSEKFCFSAVFGLHCCGCCFWIAGIPLLTYFLIFLWSLAFDYFFSPYFTNRSIVHDAILQSRSARSWVCC